MLTTLRKLTMAWPLVIFLLLPALTRGETAIQAWVQRYSGPGNGDDAAYAVAVDGSNNVIVTGQGSAYNYATIKYSSAGLPLWTNLWNDGYAAFAVAVDGSNNVIVTGEGSSDNYATIKYSSAGLPLWTNFYNGPENGSGHTSAMAVDGSNNVIVTGGSMGSGGGYDYATIKYSSAGLPLWTNRYNGSGNNRDVPYAMAVDGSNSVIVTGYSLSSEISDDYATIKYSSAGLPLWTNRYNGPGNDYDAAIAVAVDSSNNVIVTDASIGSGSGCDYATIKYSSAGVPLWTNRYDGPGNSNDVATAMAVDHGGNVIVAGYSTGIGSGYDFATVKYIRVPSPVITNLNRTDNTFQMQVHDVLQPGTLVIEACTNLTGWLPIFTNTAPTNVLFYTDPDAGNYPRRFYRAFQSP